MTKLRAVRFLFAVFVGVLAGACVTPAMVEGEGGPPDPNREIIPITDDLYRFRNHNHYSVFLVTPEGIILADPINEDAATWLKAELAARFDRPVKYVIYSHHHGDHASGGKVFADTATFIGHENMLPHLKAGGAETASVYPPDETYQDQMTVELGGKTVELYYLGRNHSDNSTVLLFPEERTAFAVDFVTVRRLPFRTLRDSYLPDWIDSLERLAELDFDILAPGHGALGAKVDVEEHQLYLEELVAGVREGIAADMTLAEIQQEVQLAKFAAWGMYNEWRKENIAGAHRILSAGGN